MGARPSSPLESSRSGSRHGRRGVLRVRLPQIAGMASYVPIALLSDHPGYITRGYRLLFLAALLTILGLILTQIADHWLKPETSTRVVGLGLLILLAGGDAGRANTGRLVVAGAVILAIGALLVRLEDSRFVSAVFWWLTGFLWLSMVIPYLLVAISDGGSHIADDQSQQVALDPGAGDVIIVMFDEFPGGSFAMSSLGVDMEAAEQNLSARGFETFRDVRVNYAITELALPSFFMMELPMGANQALSEGDRNALLGALGGRNAMVRAFDDAGYRVTMVESGWSGLRCMEIVDRCEVRSWYDEVGWSVARRSVFNGLVASAFGDPFTVGVDRSLTWLEADLPSVAADETPDLVIVHLMLPHTPIAFNAACGHDPSAGLADQVACSNRIMLEIAEGTSNAGAVLMFGDHGTKTLGQLDLPADTWTQEMVDERMTTFAAVRWPAECGEAGPISVTNLAVRLVRCMGATSVRYAADTSFATSLESEPLVEVFPRIPRATPSS